MCLGVFCAVWALEAMPIGVSDATLVIALEYWSPFPIILVSCCWGLLLATGGYGHFEPLLV